MFTHYHHPARSERRRAARPQRQSLADRRRRLAICPRLAAEQLESRLLLTAGPVGDQFLVSEAVGLEGSPPAIVVHQDGSFTAAWESFQEDGSGQGIYSRHFSASGSPLGTTQRVNTQTLDDQAHPSIAADALGNVLVVWQSRHQDTDGDGIYGQWFSNKGETKLGAEFRINTTTEGDQRSPDVAIDGAGRAIVVWQSEGQDGEEWGVYYAVLDNFEDIVPSAETLVNDVTAGTQQAPTVAAAANGNFVIAWEALDPSGAEEASLEIYAKVYVAGATEVPTEFQVNTEMLRDQVSPQAAIDNDGDFVVVWQGEGIPGSGSDIFAQRFDETGAAQGTEFRVNDTTLASQVGGRVAMDGEGNFLVTWQSVHQDGFSYGVFAREYGPAGNTLENEFVVNVAQVEDPQVRPAVATFAGDGTTVVAWVGKSETHLPAVFAHVFDMPNPLPALRVGSEVKLAEFAEFEENGPAAAMDIHGNSVVVWESYGEDGSGLGVYAQRLDAFGEPRNEESAFLVNTHTLGNQSAPAVATSAEGPFVIVWQSEGQDAEGFGIYAQLYEADGSPMNGPFLVNTTQLGNQMNPAVAMDEDGDFVVVWQADSLDPADTSSDIFAQRFTATGEKVQTEWQVNQFIALDQVSPVVAMNATGEFAVAWVSSHPAATGEEEVDAEKSIFVQWYDSQGVADGGEVIAHNYVKDAQESPSVGIAASGDFVVAWQSINQDGSTWGVYGRQITRDKVALGDDEFLVHEEHTEGLQRFAGVGVEADGHFVIAWQTNSPDVEDGSSLEVYRREYLPDGTPEAAENQVNTWTEGPQTLPVVARASTGDYGIFWAGQGFSHIDGVHGRLYSIHVSDDPGQPSRLPIDVQFPVAVTVGFESSPPAAAMNADGSFTLAFESFEDDGGGFGIVRQTFSADQIPVDGTREVVNTFVDGDQSHPAIASNENGRTLIVWQSTAQDSDGQGIYGQWYESDGTRVGLEFLVNTTVVGDQLAPSVAMDGEGRAVVAWQSFDGDDWDVYYKRYAVFGDTEAEELLAPTANEGDQQAPTVAAALASGEFLIAWQGPGPVEEEGEASIEIFAQRFLVTGARDGVEFRVNVDALHDQVLPAAAMDAEGGAVVVWQAEGQQGSGSDVYGRLLSSTTEFRANKTVSGPQRSPAVSMDGDGNFLVTWQSIHQDGYSWGIYGRSYDAAGQILVDEALINERVEGPQTSVSADTNGSSQTLVIWLGNDSTHHPAVFGHRYLLPSDAAEAPSFEVGTELNLATYAGLEEVPPAAAMNADRETVVVWESYSEDGNGMGVFAQLLDAFGQPL